MTAPTSAISIRRWVLDLGASLLLVAVAFIGFWPTFGGPGFLGAAIGGTLLGLGIAAVAAWRSWSILIVAGLTAAAYFVFGGAFALSHTTLWGFVPTLETLQQLAVGTVTSWKHMLTTVAPVGAADGHLIVPFLLCLVVAVCTASFALRLTAVAWALLPVAAMLVLTIALGTPEPAFPVAQGLLLAVLAIAWLAVRQLWAPHNGAVSVGQVDPARASQMRLRRLISGAAVLAIASGAGIAVNAVAAPAEVRHVFRDVIIPPFDVRDYPSPLQGFRKHVRDDANETLFTVQGLPEDARIRIATMDQYDGMVYNVTDGGPQSSSAFAQLRSNMSPDAEGIPATLQIEIDNYSGVWVPDAGSVTEIEYSGERADALRRSTYYNQSTGTAVTTSPLAAGDTYTVHTIIPAEPSDARLADDTFGKVALPTQSNVPEEFTNLAGEATAAAETPIEKVRALETFLSEEGFFSHGLEGDVLSRSGHTAERISTLVGGDQMIGDDEQYAVTMTLLARELGIPARVVLGFYPEKEESGTGEFAATGDDVHAWVEINFAQAGWLAFDPTPPEDQVPNAQNTKPRADPKPQVLQPPPPPQEPVDLPPTLPDDRESEEEKTDVAGLIGLILAIGGISLGVIALLASPFIIIGAWKASRRRRRRTAERSADRIAGGWDELTDRAVDYGARLTSGATRGEEAVLVAGALAVPTVTALADRADAEVFGPREPSAQDVESFWKEVDEIVVGVGREAGFWKRLKARLSLRALLGDSTLSRSFQTLKDAATERRRREPGTIKNNEPVVPESEKP